MDSDDSATKIVTIFSTCSKIYHILVPFIAFAIVLLNLCAVLSSGLFLIKRETEAFLSIEMLKF